MGLRKVTHQQGLLRLTIERQDDIMKLHEVVAQNRYGIINKRQFKLICLGESQDFIQFALQIAIKGKNKHKSILSDRSES